MHGFDLHTAVDVVTLLLAFGGAFLRRNRALYDRVSALEKQAATFEGVLKGAGIL